MPAGMSDRESSVPHPMTGGPGRPPAADALSVICLVLTLLFVASFALWYTSSGQFPQFPDIQNDYVDLGDSFLRGDLALREEPDPRLAELGNPYEFTQRKGIPYHWDASYYNGRYYLYWGPIPAVISALLQLLTGTQPAASVLVGLPYLGLMGVASALLWRLAHSYGPPARRTVWLFVLVGFFSFPMLFTIGQPRHYQASIMAGQFFLLLGVLGIAEHARSRRAAWLVVSGLSWGFALGSRYNLAISIAAYLLIFAIWQAKGGLKSAWRRYVLVAAPLGICLLGLGIYNLARFGDPMETGLTYQLTIPEFRQISYSAAYVPSGLYTYLLYPMTGARTFPYIQAAHFRPNQLPAGLFVPDGRVFDQVIFGLLPTVPAMWLFALVFPLVIGSILAHRVDVPLRAPPSWTRPVVSMLSVGAAGQLLFLLLFFYVAERYIVDFYIPLVICLASIVWSANAALSGRPILQGALWAVVVLLAGRSTGIAYFACFGVPVLVSLYYDPAMLLRLREFWNSGYTALLSILPGAP